MSTHLLVTEKPERQSFLSELFDGRRAAPAGVEWVAARAYLTDPSFVGRRARVFNLCRSHRYQSLGYYVSLLAEARGHRPLPSVATIQDLKSPSLVRLVTDDLERTVERSLAPIASDAFTLSVYFGRNLAERHRRLALQLFHLFPAPLLRAEFRRVSEGEKGDGGAPWQLRRLRALALDDVPTGHQPFLLEAAERYFAGHGPRRGKTKPMRFDLAILVDPKEENAPSDERAIRRMTRAFESVGLRTQVIGRDDLGRLATFDALFLRATTAVDHYTYRFARRAAAEGLVVIDDPESILHCTNKVYLAELLERGGVGTPRTRVVHRENLDEVLRDLGLPLILKLPDGSFSKAVVKVEDKAEFDARARDFLDASDLVLAQEFLPTEFDWRVGLLAGEVLWTARYGMARGHWQIADHGSGGKVRYGAVEAVDPALVPARVLRAARNAAALVGDGLYGVDVKDVEGRALVIEVNDNPNLDAGSEDAFLGQELYLRLAKEFLDRIERAKSGGRAGGANE